ncbi:MAG TPA: M14 family zinc carboxypeptidase [Holophagaceae bacterium]|nr:M14 family zinc carboxypeptidase [Holophagaceae bacterium]
MKRLLPLLSTTLLAQAPLTVPEATHWARTSTTAEVAAYMELLGKAHPQLVPYTPPGAPTRTETGKLLQAWRLPATKPGALRVYLNGNIHAGEVEGKEAIQFLLREVLEGAHPELRERIEFVVMPCYNAEGTDALDPAHRRYQPNPASGVGRRETDRGLDLNRDGMKAEAANTRWFLAMLQDFDPHAVFDLHTTNGSTHGFHLTWAPALTLGGDPALLAFNRKLLVEVRDQLKAQGLPTWDYGNFGPDERGRKAPEVWESYDPLPRYLVNYAGLQGRLGILSEAYVYRTFEQRVRETRAFVLQCLRWMAAHPRDVEHATAMRLQPLHAGDTLPLAAKLVETEKAPFEVVELERNAEGLPIAEKGRHTVTLPSLTTFQDLPEGLVKVPAGFLMDGAWADRLRPLLEAHGVKVLPGTARPALPPAFFTESGRKVAPRAFQGVFELELQGRWTAEAPKGYATWTAADLDRALWVPLDQPRGRVAFYLLDPRSPDSLAHWGLFHSVLLRGGWGEAARFPLVALGHPGDPQPAAQGTPAARKPE